MRIQLLVHIKCIEQYVTHAECSKIVAIILNKTIFQEKYPVLEIVHLSSQLTLLFILCTYFLNIIKYFLIQKLQSSADFIVFKYTYSLLCWQPLHLQLRKCIILLLTFGIKFILYALITLYLCICMTVFNCQAASTTITK